MSINLAGVTALFIGCSQIELLPQEIENEARTVVK